jgi:hypothetical protein
LSAVPVDESRTSPFWASGIFECPMQRRWQG